MTVYPTLFSRLVANTAEPENNQACWVWTGTKRCRFGYGRFNVRVPGLGGKHVALSAHLAAYVLFEIGCSASVDDLYLGYLELRESGLELDHLCQTTGCLYPDHLDPVTHAENCRRRKAPPKRGVFCFDDF